MGSCLRAFAQVMCGRANHALIRLRAGLIEHEPPE